MKLTKIALLTAVIAAAYGCTSTPSFQTGDNAEVTFDGLTRMDNTVMDAAWARDDVDLTGLRKIILDPIGVEYRPSTGPYSGRAGITSSSSRRTNSSDFSLTEESRRVFEEEISAAFVEELGSSSILEIVEEPGDDVLRVRIGLHDVVSRVPPETSGRGGTLISSVGEATLFLQIHDSVSNAIYARAVDRRAAQSGNDLQPSNQASNRAEVRRLGRRWGAILRDALEAISTDGLPQ